MRAKHSSIEQDGSLGPIAQCYKNNRACCVQRSTSPPLSSVTAADIIFIVRKTADHGLEATIKTKAQAIPERFNNILFFQDFLLNSFTEKEMIERMTYKTFLAAFSVCI